MRLPGPLGFANKSHVGDALQWLMYAVVLGALPFWGVAFLQWIHVQPLSAELFVEHAELAVYGAGLLAAAIPTMQREIKDAPVKQPRWFLLFAITLIVGSSLLFGSVANRSAEGYHPEPSAEVARTLWTSIALVALSLLLCFLTELINNVRLEPDVRGMKKQEVDDLSRQVVDRLQDQERD